MPQLYLDRPTADAPLAVFQSTVRYVFCRSTQSTIRFAQPFAWVGVVMVSIDLACLRCKISHTLLNGMLVLRTSCLKLALPILAGTPALERLDTGPHLKGLRVTILLIAA